MLVKDEFNFGCSTDILINILLCYSKSGGVVSVKFGKLPILGLRLHLQTRLISGSFECHDAWSL